MAPTPGSRPITQIRFGRITDLNDTTACDRIQDYRIQDYRGPPDWFPWLNPIAQCSRNFVLFKINQDPEFVIGELEEYVNKVGKYGINWAWLIQWDKEEPGEPSTAQQTEPGNSLQQQRMQAGRYVPVALNLSGSLLDNSPMVSPLFANEFPPTAALRSPGLLETYPRADVPLLSQPPQYMSESKSKDAYGFDALAQQLADHNQSQVSNLPQHEFGASASAFVQTLAHSAPTSSGATPHSSTPLNIYMADQMSRESLDPAGFGSFSTAAQLSQAFGMSHGKPVPQGLLKNPPQMFLPIPVIRLLCTITKCPPGILPNFIEYLYMAIDELWGDGYAVRCALHDEIPSLADFEKKPIQLPKRTPGWKPREPRVPLEYGEAIQLHAAPYPDLPQPETLPPNLNVPDDPVAFQRYMQACHKSRATAYRLLHMVGMTDAQIDNYHHRQPMHPLMTPEVKPGSDFGHLFRQAPWGSQNSNQFRLSTVATAAAQQSSSLNQFQTNVAHNVAQIRQGAHFGQILPPSSAPQGLPAPTMSSSNAQLSLQQGQNLATQAPSQVQHQGSAVYQAGSMTPSPLLQRTSLTLKFTQVLQPTAMSSSQQMQTPMSTGTQAPLSSTPQLSPFLPTHTADSLQQLRNQALNQARPDFPAQSPGGILHPTYAQPSGSSVPSPRPAYTAESIQNLRNQALAQTESRISTHQQDMPGPFTQSAFPSSSATSGQDSSVQPPGRDRSRSPPVRTEPSAIRKRSPPRQDRLLRILNDVELEEAERLGIRHPEDRVPRAYGISLAVRILYESNKSSRNKEKPAYALGIGGESRYEEMMAQDTLIELRSRFGSRMVEQPTAGGSRPPPKATNPREPRTVSLTGPAHAGTPALLYLPQTIHPTSDAVLICTIHTDNTLTWHKALIFTHTVHPHIVSLLRASRIKNLETWSKESEGWKEAYTVVEWALRNVTECEDRESEFDKRWRVGERGIWEGWGLIVNQMLGMEGSLRESDRAAEEKREVGELEGKRAVKDHDAEYET